MKRKKLKKFLISACHVLEDSQRNDSGLTIGGENDAFKLTLEISNAERTAFIVALSSVASLVSDANHVTTPTIFAQSITTVYAMMRNEMQKKEDMNAAVHEEAESE